jgi:hypothetical protein
MTDNMDKIIARVQKLLNLAGNNPNENEAAAAVEKAHAILAEHNLDMAHIKEADLNSKEGADMVREKMDVESKFKLKSFSWLWNGVAKAHFCKLYMRKTPKGTIYTFVGRRINTIVAAQMAQYLTTTVWRLVREEAKKVDAEMPGAGFKPTGALNSNFVTNFVEGAVLRLCKRLQEMETSGGAKGALVLYNADEARLNEEFIRQALGIKLKASKNSGSARRNSDAFSRGDRAGGNISLNQQVGGSKPSPRVGATLKLR